MPYGMKGGDTAASNAFMERCVSSVMKGRGVDKVRAIVICKAQYQKSKRKR